jgi:hypothetical protein
MNLGRIVDIDLNAFWQEAGQGLFVVFFIFRLKVAQTIGNRGGLTPSLLVELSEVKRRRVEFVSEQTLGDGVVGVICAKQRRSSLEVENG